MYVFYMLRMYHLKISNKKKVYDVVNCGWFWCLRYLILHVLTVFTGKPQIISIDLLTSWGFPPALLVFVVHSPALSYSTIKHNFISVLLFMICCPISFMIREGNGGVSIHATELPVFKSRSSLIFDFIGGRMNTEYNSYVCQGFIWTSVKKKKWGGGGGFLWHNFTIQRKRHWRQQYFTTSFNLWPFVSLCYVWS